MHRSESQLYPGLHDKKSGQQIEGSDSTPLLHFGETTWSTVPSAGALSTGKLWMCWREPRGGHKNDPRGGVPLLEGQTERVWVVVEPAEEKVAGRTYCSLPVHKGGLQERWRGIFLQGHVVIGKAIIT